MGPRDSITSKRVYIIKSSLLYIYNNMNFLKVGYKKNVLKLFMLDLKF